MNPDTKDKIGDIIDKIDNLKCSLSIPLPPAMHVDIMKLELEDISTALKSAYEAETGENPWIDQCNQD